jgi:outer membrane translocation and assembly module TamA
VGEKAMLNEKIRITPDNTDWSEFLVTTSKYTPELEEKLRPLIDAETALNDLTRRIGENLEKQKTLAADEGRDRDNLTALKGNDAAKRFVEELNRAEDEIEAARKEQAGLEKDRDAARAHLEIVIAALSFDTDLSVVTQSSEYGDRAPRR